MRTLPQDFGTEPPDAVHSTHQLSFWGSGGSLFGIHLVNLFFTLLTFGIYSFWAKVRVRAYLWSQIQFAADRLAYHGTGKELLRGFLRAMVLFGIPYALLTTGPELAGAAASLQAGASLLAVGLVLVFLPVAIVAARRYRLSRTSWRGIRFSYRGSIWGFVKLFLTGMFFNIVTLGAYYPFFDVKRQAYLTSHTYVGNRSFHFDGEAWELAKYFLWAYLLTPFTLGLCWFWYTALKKRYFWSHTTIEGSRFDLTITGLSLFWLQFANLFLLVITFGFAWPWVTVRNIDFVVSNLTLKGPAQMEAILQDSQSATPTGEGLDSLLDTGLDFG